VLGLATRSAAFIASGSMAYAYFKIHQPNALWPMQNGGEAAAMFSWTLLLLVFTGSGAFGLDRLLARRSAAQGKRKTEQTPVAV
jgi:putative oxidoreductase